MCVVEMRKKACQVGVVRPVWDGVVAIRCLFCRNQSWWCFVSSKLWKCAYEWRRGERSGQWSSRVLE